MILVTGGTGFIGNHLVRKLTQLGKPVRMLLHPASEYPKLPRSIPVDVALSSFQDSKSLKAAMRDVEIILHLAGTERRGTGADLENVDILGTRNLVEVAENAGVGRFVMLSHIGADRASAFPVMKAKGIGEQFVIQSKVSHTIVRSAAVFGPGDQFTTSLAGVIKASPGFFLMPGDGRTKLQPLWIYDLITCISMIINTPDTAGKVYSIGGQEYITFQEIIDSIMAIIGRKKPIVNISFPLLRALSVWLENSNRNFPISVYWLDYLAVDRTTSIDVLPSEFGIMPERFRNNLDYLKELKHAK